MHVGRARLSRRSRWPARACRSGLRGSPPGPRAVRLGLEAACDFGASTAGEGGSGRLGGTVLEARSLLVLRWPRCPSLRGGGAGRSCVRTRSRADTALAVACEPRSPVTTPDCEPGPYKVFPLLDF